jgi:hypothetical protein
MFDEVENGGQFEKFYRYINWVDIYLFGIIGKINGVWIYLFGINGNLKWGILLPFWDYCRSALSCIEDDLIQENFVEGMYFLKKYIIPNR